MDIWELEQRSVVLATSQCWSELQASILIISEHHPLKGPLTNQNQFRNLELGSKESWNSINRDS